MVLEVELVNPFGKGSVIHLDLRPLPRLASGRASVGAVLRGLHEGGPPERIELAHLNDLIRAQRRGGPSLLSVGALAHHQDGQAASHK